MTVEEYGFEPQDHFDHFFTISVFVLFCYFFFFFENLKSFLYFLFTFLFYTTLKIITGRRHWVLTEESPID